MLGHHKNTNNPTNNPFSAHANPSINDPNYPNSNTYNQPLNSNYPNNSSNQPLNHSNYNSMNQPSNYNSTNQPARDSNYNSNTPNTYNQPLNPNSNTYNQPLNSGINDKDRLNNTTDPYRNDNFNRTNNEQGSLNHPHTGYHHHGNNHHHGTTNTTGTGLGATSGTFDADKDRYMNRVGQHTNNTSNVGTQPYNNTGTTGLGTGTGIGASQYGSTGTTGLGTGTQYGSTGTTQQPYGTTGATQQGYGTQQQPYGTQQQGYGTSGNGTAPGVNRPMSVEDVTRNVQAQIDAQAEQAIRKSRELNAQDHARLQSSIREATASLEEQARQLKLQIDQEKAQAAQHVRQTHDQRLHETAQVQQMEEQKILEAAAQRKIELEQRSMKIQQEIDAIVRQKTEEMMREKPGNLCFTHQHQDTTIGAQLAGDIGHILDLKNSGRVTETTMQGNNQYQPIPNQPTTASNWNEQQPSNIPIQQNTIQGQETHEKKGGFFHALKTALTGHHDNNNNTNTNQYGTNTNTNQYGTKQPGYNHNIKQQPMVGNAGYDQQSTWASDADKHMPQQQQAR